MYYLNVLAFLTGKTPTEKALVDQWLEYVSLHLQDNSETASNLQVRKDFRGFYLSLYLL